MAAAAICPFNQTDPSGDPDIEKPRGKARYRVMWNQNAGQAGFHNPPMSPERNAQAHFGYVRLMNVAVEL